MTADQTLWAIGPERSHFLCELGTIFDRIDAIDPRAYARTRNALDGAVTWMGPFLTHGIVDTREIADRVLTGAEKSSCYRLLFELAWREFFHRTWQREGDAIFTDMREPQPLVASERLPLAVLEAATGIEVIDTALRHLLEEGVMHNHARLWVAAICCNLGHTAWREPARWLHHHLLDGDLASNTLSWQWVAGTFSDKRYVANQENINRFSGSTQHDTWIDVPYDAFDDFPLPRVLSERGVAALPFTVRGLPLSSITLPDEPVALRSIWHLDPRWRADIGSQIVFVDTDWLESWPLSSKRWDFIEHWAAACGATLVHGTLNQLHAVNKATTFHRIEYPACRDWPGVVEERRWLYTLPAQPFPSFSRFWKQVRRDVGL